MNKTKLGQTLIMGLSEAIDHTRGVKQLRTSTLEIPGPAKRWPKEQVANLESSVSA